MLSLSVIACIVCSRSVNGLQIGAFASIRQQDIASVFFEDEFFGIHNRTKNDNILTVQVVIEEQRLVQIQQNEKVLQFEITAPDYAVVIGRERARINNRTIWKPHMQQSEANDFFDEFRSWPEYEAFFDYLLETYPDLVTNLTLGTTGTVQGREIPVFKLSTEGTAKPSMYIQASVHSGEWLANSATTWILNELCEKWTAFDDDIRHILENLDIFITPTVNIDGYIYTWIDSTTRNWRKNRRNNEDGSFGVDLNRNYGPSQFWGIPSGCSHTPSSNNYCGPFVFSEPETQSVRDFLLTRLEDSDLRAAIDMHTTGPYILWPWGHTTELLEAQYFDFYEQLGEDMSLRAWVVNGNDYVSIPSSQWYLTSGVFHDFILTLGSGTPNYDVIGMTFEGPPIGNPNAPPIAAAGEEQMAALMFLARTIIEDN